MASAKKRRIVKKLRYTHLQKVGAAVCLLCFVVMLAAGILAEVPVLTIAYRAFWVMLAVKIILRVLVSVLSTYEEMNSGQA